MAIGSEDLKFRVIASVTGQKSIDGLKSSFDGLNGAGKTLVSGLKFLAGAFAVKEAISFGKSLIDTGEELKALSQKTGITVKDLAGLKGAAEQGDIAFDGLVTGLRKLTVNLGEAAGGNKEVVAAFKSVGVAALDANGQIRPTGDVIKNLADKFASLKDGPEKAAIAVKLFGKSGTDMIPFLNQGSEALEKFGLAIDDDFAGRADNFNDTLTRIGNQIKSAGISALGKMLPTLQEVADAFENIKGEDVPGVFEAIGEAVRISAVLLYDFSEAVVEGADVLVSFSRIVYGSVIGSLKALGDQISTRAAQLKALASLDFAGAGKLGDDLAQRSVDRDKQIVADRDQILNDFVKRSEERSAKLDKFNQSLLKNSLVFGNGTTDEILKRQKDATDPGPIRPSGLKSADIAPLNAARDAEADKIKNFLEMQKLENEQRRESLNDINLTTLELAKKTEADKFDLEVQKQMKGLSEERQAQFKAEADLIKQQRLELIELDYQQKRTWQYGAKEAFREYAENAGNAAKGTKELFDHAFSNMEDAIVDFAKTGKLDFKKFADDLITDIIRIQVRMLLAQAVTGASGLFASFFGGGAAAATSSTVATSNSLGATFADGGIMTSKGRVALRQYAGGGIARSPQVAVFGEGSTPEAYVPVPSGKIPVEMNGAAGNTSVVVNVNVNSDGSSESDSQATGEKAKAFGNLMKSVVLDVIVQQKRPGGLLTT